ncbi:MAG TPA: aldehyde dehydrogenase family protein, partial [Thermoanaerobaculia bacterium]|nr:aldehyde dehydrogenase family protein [Thermoanaerobaculia bacterium]
MEIVSVNPTTGQVVARFQPFDGRMIEERLSRAAHAFRGWRTSSFGERADALRRLAELFLGERERWASLMVEEMGKTIR